MKRRLGMIVLAVSLLVSQSLGATRDEIAQQLHIDVHASNRVLTIAANLYTLRCQMELYRIQHNSVAPAMQNMNVWQALTGKSKSDGTLSMAYNDVGPYLTVLPQNPFMKSACVVPAGKATAGAGWTYDEKTSHLRAIIPAECAAEAAFLPFGDYELLDPHGLVLVTLIQKAQFGLLVYNINHHRQYPSLQDMADWKPILEAGSAQPGEAKPKLAVVPLTAPLENPLTNSARIVAAGHPTADAGWTYDEKAGTLRAIVPSSQLKNLHEVAEGQYELVPG